MNALSYLIRSLRSEDEPFLWEMLYHAIHVSEGQVAPPRDIVHLPDLARYVQGWGRSGDQGFLAYRETTGQSLGAVWIRLLIGEGRGYGYVDEDTPELSIAVLPQYRSQGIGTALLGSMVSSVSGYASISLSVSADNPALRLYKRFGFRIISQDAGSFTMRRDTTGQQTPFP